MCVCHTHTHTHRGREKPDRCKLLKKERERKVEELLEEKQRDIPQADKCMHMNEELKESRLGTHSPDYKQTNRKQREKLTTVPRNRLSHPNEMGFERTPLGCVLNNLPSSLMFTQARIFLKTATNS